MDKKFDIQESKQFLEKREALEKEQREQERIAFLAKATKSLRDLFLNSGVEVYLVGSITQPYMFYPHSDVDVVLKNFNGDRFDVWTQLETMIRRNVEIILFEHCHFQDHVIKLGYKVL